MIYQELKRCPICGEWRADYEFEEIFTGRMQRVCYKCIREGHKEIMVAPSVIPQPKEGEWIRQGISPHEGIQKCSLCGAMYDIAAEFDNCPNCHAKMKGADDE